MRKSNLRKQQKHLKERKARKKQMDDKLNVPVKDNVQKCSRTFDVKQSITNKCKRAKIQMLAQQELCKNRKLQNTDVVGMHKMI